MTLPITENRCLRDPLTPQAGGPLGRSTNSQTHPILRTPLSMKIERGKTRCFTAFSITGCHVLTGLAYLYGTANKNVNP